MSTVPTLNNKSNDLLGEDIGIKPDHINFNGIDCKFIVGRNCDKIFGNRMIFVLESAVFEDMLCDNVSEIPLPYDDPQVFRNLRYIMYNKNLGALDHFSMEDIVKVSQLSQTYKVLSVSQLCREYTKQLLKTAELSDVLAAHDFAIKANHKDIQQMADEFLNSKAEENELDFLNDISEYFINPEKKGAADRFNASDKTKNKLLQQCLNSVDFGQMSIADFMNGPSNSDILTLDQKYFILTKMVSSAPVSFQNAKCTTTIKLNRMSVFMERMCLRKLLK